MSASNITKQLVAELSFIGIPPLAIMRIHKPSKPKIVVITPEKQYTKLKEAIKEQLKQGKLHPLLKYLTVTTLKELENANILISDYVMYITEDIEQKTEILYTNTPETTIKIINAIRKGRINLIKKLRSTLRELIVEPEELKEKPELLHLCLQIITALHHLHTTRKHEEYRKLLQKLTTQTQQAKQPQQTLINQIITTIQTELWSWTPV